MAWWTVDEFSFKFGWFGEGIKFWENVWFGLPNLYKCRCRDFCLGWRPWYFITPHKLLVVVDSISMLIHLNHPLILLLSLYRTRQYACSHWSSATYNHLLNERAGNEWKVWMRRYTAFFISKEKLIIFDS